MITLTTDFGLADEYVGLMKGVILTICPSVRIVDLTHGIRPQDVRQAALLIASAHQYFPDHTIHVVVVDPGVGSARRIILLEAFDQFFLVPDNGVASLLFKKAAKAYDVTESSLFLHPTSNTFHGRDIFAPVAAHLSNGLPPDKTGMKIPLTSLVRLPLARTWEKDNLLHGTVMDIDHFGNIITNIRQKTATRFCSGNFQKLSVSLGPHTIIGIMPSYDSLAPGTLLALFNSRNFLEIAVNRQNAAEKLKVTLNDRVHLSI